MGFVVIDPVCLKQLDEMIVLDKAEYRGQTYYFHSERCRNVFEQAPENFAGKVAQIVYGDQHRFEAPEAR